MWTDTPVDAVAVLLLHVVADLAVTAPVDVNEYLAHYGFLDKTVLASRGGAASIKDNSGALIHFQQMYGLLATGKVDDSTLSLMRTPRCGSPDVQSKDSRRRQRRSLVSAWSDPRETLRYYVRNEGRKTDGRLVEGAVWKALQQWQNVSSLKFERASRPHDAHINIVFPAENADHDRNCTSRFGESDLAHAFFPSVGLVHFSAKYDWNDRARLEPVTLHELGHALGLAHSLDPRSIMYAYNTPDPKVITTTEINNLREAYGAKPGLHWVQEDRIRPWSDSPSPPDVCSSRIDAAFRRRGDYVFFRGGWVWRFSRDGRSVHGPWRISHYYHGQVERVDAAVEIGDDVYLFNGDELFIERQQRMMRPISLRSIGIKGSDRVDIAFRWNAVNYESQQSYYFLDQEEKMYYRYDPLTRRVAPHYPRRSDKNWKAVPEDASAAFEYGDSGGQFVFIRSQFKDEERIIYIVFVAGTNAYLMTVDASKNIRVADGFPRPLYSLFPACDQRASRIIDGTHHHNHHKNHHHHEETLRTLPTSSSIILSFSSFLTAAYLLLLL